MFPLLPLLFVDVTTILLIVEPDGTDVLLIVKEPRAEVATVSFVPKRNLTFQQNVVMIQKLMLSELFQMSLFSPSPNNFLSFCRKSCDIHCKKHDNTYNNRKKRFLIMNLSPYFM